VLKLDIVNEHDLGVGEVLSVIDTVPVDVTGSEKLTIRLIISPVIYAPLEVADVTELIIGDVVSMTIVLLAVRLVAGTILVITFPTRSRSVPETLLIDNPALVSVACTVYMQEPDELFETEKVQVLGVGDVLSVIVTRSVDVTASEKLAIILIIAPAVYEPLAVAEVMLVIVGDIVSITIDLLSDKPVAGLTFVRVFVATSFITPVTLLTSKSELTSLASTVYVQLPLSDPVTVMVQVLGVGVVFKDTVISPVDDTTSEKVRVILTAESTVYVPLAVVDVTDRMVGAVVSITILLLALKLVAGTRLVIGIETMSKMVPTTLLTVRSELVSVA
jgi:hypothetical protein